MKTNDLFTRVTSAHLTESFEKSFGSRINLDKYTREELEDMRNKLRTRVFQHEGASKYNDLLTNETYQKDMAMLQILNTRIKEMLGESLEQMAKSLNSSHNVVENSPKANKAAAKKTSGAANRAKTRDQQRSTASKNTRDAAQSRGIAKNKDGTYQPKESKMKENDEFAIKKSQIPAAQRKAKGGDWKVSQTDLDKEASRSRSSDSGLAREKSKLRSKGVMEEPADKSQIPAVQRKAKAKGGDDWRVSLADLDKEASKSRSTKTGLDREKAGLKAKGMMETDNPSAGMTKKEKSAVVKKARAGKDIGKPGKGFAKVEKAAKKGGARNPKAVAAAAMWKQQAKESFRRNVRMVNESLAHYIMEDEEGKAKTITAASDIVNDFTSWMQRVGQYQTKALIELADDIRADFGLQQSEQFKQAVAPALAAALESLTQQREAISNAVAVLAGEDLPQDMMGVPPEGEAGPGTPDMEPMEPATPDEMNEPGDEFGASDAAAGAGITGRELRESAFSRRLAESHSIMAKLAK